MELDHLAISAEDLGAGAEVVESALGVRLSPGGEHPLMGTHNRLLGLGPIYLEVIAINPSAPPPGRPRWFDLDHFSGPPRLTNWVARCDDLDAALAAAPPGTGAATDLQRGDLRWRMGVPQDGRLPFGEAFPALIQWQAGGHPCERLPDSGCRLTALEISHPEPDALRTALGHFFAQLPVTISAGAVALRAEIATPHGRRNLT